MTFSPARPRLTTGEAENGKGEIRPEFCSVQLGGDVKLIIIRKRRTGNPESNGQPYLALVPRADEIISRALEDLNAILHSISWTPSMDRVPFTFVKQTLSFSCTCQSRSFIHPHLSFEEVKSSRPTVLC